MWFSFEHVQTLLQNGRVILFLVNCEQTQHSSISLLHNICSKYVHLRCFPYWLSRVSSQMVVQHNSLDFINHLFSCNLIWMSDTKHHFVLIWPQRNSVNHLWTTPYDVADIPYFLSFFSFLNSCSTQTVVLYQHTNFIFL